MIRFVALILVGSLLYGEMAVARPARAGEGSAAHQVAWRRVAPNLRPAISAIMRLPAGRQLMREAQGAGPISFQAESSSGRQFEAYWDGSRRIVVVRRPEVRSVGSVIRSIVFELHNAITNRLLIDLTDQAARGALSADEYVEGIERMEHQNALWASRLLREGIEQGVFPMDAGWEIYPSFEDHYKVQQVTGHSLWIADSYSRMARQRGQRSRYKGTIPGLFRLSSGDKRELIRYLAMKNEIENGTPTMQRRCSHMLSREIASLESQGDRRQLRLLSFVFENRGQLQTLRAVAA